MEPLDFLAAVLPSTGVYCVAELTSKKKEHKYVQSLEDVATFANKFSGDGKDAFFALAAFREAGNRLAVNAQSMRVLALDIEAAGRDYPTKKDGLAALADFLEVTGLDGLGAPWLVDSGGGVHVYWPFELEVPIRDWQPVAEALKRLAKHHGLLVDMTVTADASRVLRVPGTTNYKYPKPVALKHKGAIFQFEDLKRVIGVVEPPAQKIEIEGTAPKAMSPTALKLMENTATSFRAIMMKSTEGKGCKQLEYYIDHAQDDGMEPLWRGLLSIAKHCEDADRAALKISTLHPYTQERMEQKLREIKGPYPCTKLDSENPGVCEQCAHWGKITNPLALGREVQTNVEPKIIELPAEDPQEDAVKYIRPSPPKTFSYGNMGGIYREVVDKDEDGTTGKRILMVLQYDFFIVDLMHVEGVHTAHFLALRPGGAQDILVPMKSVVTKDDTVKALAQQNIIAAFGSGNDKNLFEYVRACVEEASVQKAPTHIPTQYGWQADKSFVFNSRVYYPDGTNRQTPMPGLENITSSTQPKGTLEGWQSVINLLVRKRMHEILAHGCIGFGAPLMAFTGMRGLTFHAGHKESGTGKSLALSVVASVWGNPVDYRTGKSTSPVAMQQRAGNLNSLPFVCDELTMKARADMEWFPGFVFDFSEGRGKERMEASSNRERVNSTTWNSLAFFTSNTRMLDYMTGVRQFSSEGELRRFLEWSPSQKLEFTEEEQKTITSLHSNYGVAGEKYAKWLVTNRDTAKRIVEEVKERLFVEFEATNDERFWVAGVSAVVAGAVLAGPEYANVVKLPIKSIIGCFKGMIENSRAAIKSNVTTAEDILNDFTREFYGQFIVVRKSNGSLMAALGNGELIDQSMTRSKIAGRVEHDVSPGWVDYYIEEQVLKRHCSLFSYGYQDFKRDIEKVFKVSYVRKDMTMGTKGPHMRVNAMRVSRPVTEDENNP